MWPRRVMMLFWLGLLVALPSLSAAAITAHWTLNESASPSIDTVGSLSCTWTNSPTPTIGSFGNGIAVDGAADRYLDCGSSATLAPSAPFSIAFWMKVSGTPAQFSGVLGRTTADTWDDGYGFFFNSASELRFFINNWATNVAWMPITSLNQWNHVVGIYDGTNVRIFINTVEGTRDPLTGAVVSGGVLRLGRLSPLAAYDTPGLSLDEVWYFNHALTQVEIDDLYYANTLTGGGSAPVAPTTPQITTQADTSLNLSWTPSTSPGIINHRLYRCVFDTFVHPSSSCTPVYVRSVGAAATAHDASLVPQTTYRYAVSAVSVDGESPLSTLFLGTTTQTGLASQYPRDINIEQDAQVKFVERFSGSIATITSRYDSVSSAGLSTSIDVPANSPDQSLVMPELTQLYKNLAPIGAAESDMAFLRYYVKYVTGAFEGHSGVWLGGYDPALNFAFPRAGCKPDTTPGSGNQWMHIAFEPSFGLMRPYVYWLAMHQNDATSCGGCPAADPLDPNRCYWGNTFVPASGHPAMNVGAWRAIEIMVRLNNPVTGATGAYAVWLDGVKVSHFEEGIPTGTWSQGAFTAGSGAPFEGLQWRNTATLPINNLWVQNYTPSSSTELRLANLVFGETLIGPLSGQVGAIGPGVTSQCIISWNAPTTNADGTPLTDLANYRIYTSQTSGVYGAYTLQLPVGTSQAGCTALGLTQFRTQYYMRITAVDTSGNESLPSAEFPLYLSEGRPAPEESTIFHPFPFGGRRVR